MNFLEKLDYLMGKRGLNKNRLSQLSGVPYTTIDGFYKKGYENTKISTIRKIADALDVSLDYLVDDNIVDERYHPSSNLFRVDFGHGETNMKKASPYAEEAKQLVETYSQLDQWGKRLVWNTAQHELARVQDEIRFMERAEEEKEEKVIPLYLSAPAAGFAAPIMGEDYDLYTLGPDAPQGALYAVRIRGDSMEPYFPDGSIVFCNKDPLRDGEVGVFAVDGESVIKQYHYDKYMGITYLFSLNRKRAEADIVIVKSSGRSLTCLGKVITNERFPIPE